MDRGELEGFDRESLVVRAQAAGIRRARILTRPELIDELLRLDPSASEAQLRRSRGFFGRARDLVARVVERGLHLPDAAERIRTLAGGGDLPYSVPRTEPQAMPTVTLAEIYAAQGHPERAIETLRRVLEREPEHMAAEALLARLEDQGYVAPPPPMPPEPEIEPDLNAAEEESAEDVSAVAKPIAAEPHPFGGRTHAVVAAADKDVDALAVTGIVPVLPEAEEHDECVAIPLPAPDAAQPARLAPGPRAQHAVGGGARTYVRWRVSFRRIGALLGARPGGRFVVRAHVVTPSWDGPLVETRDRPIDPDADDAILEGLPEPSVVRVAVGWLDGETFIPLAHSPALEVSPARGLVIWTPQGRVNVLLDDPRMVSIARAFDGSRRAAAARG